MKYSIIITYRNREKHLEMLLPKLTEIFKDEEYEIIISEQDNNEKFQKNSLYNLAVRKAKGKILVFHDVDYYPAENVSYFTEGDTPFYPVGKVIFLDNGNLGGFDKYDNLIKNNLNFQKLVNNKKVDNK